MRISSLKKQQSAHTNKIRKREKYLLQVVLVTGCDTGIGHELAKHLDILGFQVVKERVYPCNLIPGDSINIIRCGHHKKVVF